MMKTNMQKEGKIEISLIASLPAMAPKWKAGDGSGCSLMVQNAVKTGRGMEGANRLICSIDDAGRLKRDREASFA
jgi:hypothetical protein